MEIPDYPVHRYESNCDKWALEAEMAFAKLGVADALALDASEGEGCASMLACAGGHRPPRTLRKIKVRSRLHLKITSCFKTTQYTHKIDQ